MTGRRRFASTNGCGMRVFVGRARSRRRAASGLIRVNGNRVEKPAARVRVGDTVTVPTAREAVVVKVLALGMRRGPPAEARALYETIEGA